MDFLLLAFMDFICARRLLFLNISAEKNGVISGKPKFLSVFTFRFVEIDVKN